MPSRHSLTVAGCSLLALMFCACSAVAQVSLPPPATASATDWANWINAQMPQAVPQQVIYLGVYDFHTKTMGWDWHLYPCFLVSPQFRPANCGETPPDLSINSYNVTYQFIIQNAQSDYPLHVVLTTPAANGSQDWPGVIDGTSATIQFHPHSVRTQLLKIMHGETVVSSFPMIPDLAPQLGAFVVPYLPVAIIYQPPSCGQCPPGSTTACGSTANWQQGSAIGTTLSWGTASTSGIAHTTNSAAFFDGLSKFASAVKFVAGLIPGAQGVASGADTVSQIAGAVSGISNTQTISGSSQTTGETQSRGWAISLNFGYGTFPCQDDIIVYLQNVLFMYAVVLTDPASGNVSTSGEPTVLLTAVRYDGPPHGRLFSQLQNELPAHIVDEFRAFDLQMNPHSLQAAIFQSSHGVGPPLSLPGLKRGKRLVDQGIFECPTEIESFVSAQNLHFTSSELSSATTNFTSTTVSGLIASITGTSGTTSQSITYSSNVTNWQSVSQTSGLTLYCPNYLPNVALNVEVYLDTVFGTLIAIPGEVETGQPVLSGEVIDARGTPLGGKEVTLGISGKSFHVFSDAQGKFIFRSKTLPRGTGTLAVGSSTVPVTYTGSPLSNIKIGLRQLTPPR